VAEVRPVVWVGRAGWGGVEVVKRGKKIYSLRFSVRSKIHIQSYLLKRDAKKAVPLRAKPLLTIVICMDTGLKRQNKVSRLDQFSPKRVPT
jgi:hypothetical protein